MTKRKGIMQLTDILDEYSKDIQEGITNAAIHVAEEGKTDLKATTGTYKVRSGKYNKGWRIDKRNGRGFVHTTIYNKTDYQLTHLLEKGHDLIGRDGQKKGRTRAFVHIYPVEQKCINKFEQDVENVIKNGG